MGKALLIGAAGLLLIFVATHDFGDAKPLITWDIGVTWAHEKPAELTRRASPEAVSPAIAPYGAPASLRDFAE
jgi:hypothetical protein